MLELIGYTVIVVIFILVCWHYEVQMADMQNEINARQIRINKLEAEADTLAADVVERDIEIADQAETIHSWVLTQLGHRPHFEDNDPSYDWPIGYGLTNKGVAASFPDDSVERG